MIFIMNLQAMIVIPGWTQKQKKLYDEKEKQAKNIQR
jgi:hypothetical protein